MFEGARALEGGGGLKLGGWTGDSGLWQRAFAGFVWVEEVLSAILFVFLLRWKELAMSLLRIVEC